MAAFPEPAGSDAASRFGPDAWATLPLTGRGTGRTTPTRARISTPDGDATDPAETTAEDTDTATGDARRDPAAPRATVRTTTPATTDDQEATR